MEPMKSKYSGYGYHGGGRKATGIKRVSFSVSCTPEEREQIKTIAKSLDVTVSELITGILLENNKPYYEALEKIRNINNDLIKQVKKMEIDVKDLK